MKRIGALIFMSLAVAVTPLPAIGADDEFVAAFANDSHVREAISQLAARRFEPREKPHHIVLEGTCGVAGCSATTLVIQVMRTRGVNPRTRYVAATVSKFSGRMGKATVQLVRLSPIDGR